LAERGCAAEGYELGRAVRTAIREEGTFPAPPRPAPLTDAP
jgi:hypothetical protein